MKKKDLVKVIAVFNCAFEVTITKSEEIVFDKKHNAYIATQSIKTYNDFIKEALRACLYYVAHSASDKKFERKLIKFINGAFSPSRTAIERYGLICSAGNLGKDECVRLYELIGDGGREKESIDDFIKCAKYFGLDESYQYLLAGEIHNQAKQVDEKMKRFVETNKKFYEG
jgi:hypothetical protein